MGEQQAGGGPAGPGPEHGRLKAFTGTFRAEVKLWMGPGEPMVMTGTMVNTMDLGGRYLRQDYTGDPSPGPFPAFEGRGFWGYNNVAGKYEGFWIDNASNVMHLERGDLDGDGKSWTMAAEVPDPGGAGTMIKRSVITLEDEDHHRMESYHVKDGQPSKTMEITYVRSG